MSRTRWSRVRLLGGAVILVLLVHELGTGPLLEGLRAIDGRSLAAAGSIGVLTTVCCAWRWHLVGRGLDVGLPLRSAIAACYRSQFLNTTLPGGVIGDVHRGVEHGRGAGDVGRGLRAVAWERCAGQLVQLGLAIVVLLALPSPARPIMPLIAAVSAVGILGIALLVLVPSRLGRSRSVQVAVADVRRGLLARSAWPGIVAASVLVVAGHVTTFLIAARAAGATASPVRLVPLALLVLLAMGVPTNVGGWGPREGMAAWAFGVAGLGAAQGVATATVYGVMALVASLPGAAVMIVAWLQPRIGGVNQLARPRLWFPEAAPSKGALGG